jgi:hypothetical protein
MGTDKTAAKTTNPPMEVELVQCLIFKCLIREYPRNPWLKSFLFTQSVNIRGGWGEKMRKTRGNLTNAGAMTTKAQAHTAPAFLCSFWLEYGVNAPATPSLASHIFTV